MFLSIIISVYNIESYICQCISSIIAQNFEDYEVVIIDDGSTDRSPEICRNFAIDNDHITYFRKNNGGASSARNLGLQKANGDYIIFMDGDDFLVGTSSFTELNVKAGALPDFILYGCCDFDNKTGISKVSRSDYGLSQAGGLSKEEIIGRLVEIDNFPGAAWLFCAKKEFLQKNHISFKEGIKAEDLDWIFSVFQNAERMNFLDTPFYMYRKNREGSITKTFDRKSIDGLLYFISKWTPNVRSDNELQRLMYLINFHYLLVLLYAKVLRSEDFATLEVNKRALKYPQSYRLSILSWVIQVIGIRKFHWLFNLLNSIKNVR